MVVRYYPAVVTQTKGDSGYTIQALDIPEAISQGETVEETIANGVEALALAVEDYKGELPEPTPLHLLESKLDKDQRREKVLFQFLTVPEPEPAVRLNITLPGDLVKRIDAATENRSKFLADAAREKLSGRVGGGGRFTPLAGNKARAAARKKA